LTAQAHLRAVAVKAVTALHDRFVHLHATAKNTIGVGTEVEVFYALRADDI
jgi:hypothetical protein